MENLIELTPEEEASLPTEIQKIRMFLRQQIQKQRQKEETTPPSENQRRWLMPQRRKTIPQDVLKNLIGKKIFITMADGTELSGQLVNVDQANVFVMIGDKKRNLRVDEMEQVEPADEQA